MRHALTLVLLLFIAVGAVYFFVTFSTYHPAADFSKTALPEASRDQADLKSDRLPTKKLTAPRTPVPEILPPSFELVRVEPDGSTVVAGKAEPEIKVELLVGARVVGETMADSDGNFVFILEEPLRPGDHQFVLRCTAPGDVVVLSVDTAIVSVPLTKGGGVLH